VDNHRVILQEWIIEAVAMWGLAGLVFAVTLMGGDAGVADGVYRVVAGILVAFAVVTALTGARTSVIWFKICPGAADRHRCRACGGERGVSHGDGPGPR
jgi:hypothetical protein